MSSSLVEAGEPAGGRFAESILLLGALSHSVAQHFDALLNRRSLASKLHLPEMIEPVWKSLGLSPEQSACSTHSWTGRSSYPAISNKRQGDETMRPRQTPAVLLLVLSLVALGSGIALALQNSEVPAGTRFMVELRDKLEAREIKKGKKFEVRTLEALTASDGNQIPAGVKIKGRVTSVSNNEMVLRFEEIDTKNGKSPIIASVAGVSGEKDVRAKVGREGEISSSGGRGKSAAIGSAVGAAIGAGVGAAKGGAANTAIGAGIGAGAGAGVGAAAGGRDLELTKGTRLDVVLDRPLSFKARR
jgi:hypothetical protein